MTAKPRPTKIVLHQQSRTLEVVFDDDQIFNLSCEYLRVFSPSAEVRGHGPGQEVLQTGKENVNISAVESVGAYAVKLVFDDGHDSGIYSWETLYELGSQQETYWQAYLEELEKAGYERQPRA
ncbi:MAG TPA: 1-(5-phosphoribosyl)-5-((5-phosphoribosylamino)methylideneamino)imidazole-4-carboxamide isomerase [Gammaproteobacteria bacterium]|nr:1-(5-phosphoribosyl)-5-((5-phosphoribosylamino)methylideneamino)imidazole-4-carboxamide isomerase [Gammaproteobacteria bacterium]|tara:strand:- start:526 stop:894 length:369 start_codon:yes stop_codon:yes gene_type:complete